MISLTMLVKQQIQMVMELATIAMHFPMIQHNGLTEMGMDMVTTVEVQIQTTVLIVRQQT